MRVPKSMVEWPILQKHPRKIYFTIPSMVNMAFLGEKEFIIRATNLLFLIIYCNDRQDGKGYYVTQTTNRNLYQHYDNMLDAYNSMPAQIKSLPTCTCLKKLHKY